MADYAPFGILPSPAPDAAPAQSPFPPEVMAMLRDRAMSLLQPTPAAPPSAADQAAMMSETFANPMVSQMIGSLATLPQRAIDAAGQDFANRGNHNIEPQLTGPALETAMNMMGTGAIAGVPVRGAEQVLGAGAVRKLPMDETSRMARASEQGYEGPWYHGGERMDRFTENGKIDPRRATSGPMPYFTDDPAIASNYAKGKPDTSRIASDEGGDIKNYFQVAPKDLGLGGRSPLSVEQSWNFLPPETKAEILNKATRIGHSNIDAAEGQLMLHPEGTNATGASKDHWDYIMKREARGNPLTALRDLWHDSGRFYDDPSQLAEVYKLAGYPHPISEMNAPWTEAKGVFPAMLRMKNPLLTDDAKVMTEKILPALEEAFKRDRTQLKATGADQWAKESRFTPKTWVQQAKEDYAKGDNSFVWTSIPDKVTEELKRLGYDGVMDTGGKMGGQGHKVAIPFGPEQVRSKFAKFDPKSLGESGLLKTIFGAAGVGALATGREDKT